MTAFLDHSFFSDLGARRRQPVEPDTASREARADHDAVAGNDAGVLGSAPWRSIPLWVSNDRAEPYFEIYRVMPAHMLASRAEPEDWRWRFCTAEGHVQASSGSYSKATDCRDAIDALRRTAGRARVRQIADR